MERETGIEPAAPTLARSCSTTELFPHSLFKKTIVIVSKLNNKSQGLMKNFKIDFKTNQNSQNPFYLKNEHNVLSFNSNKIRSRVSKYG